MWQFQPKPGHLQSPSGLSVIYEIASSVLSHKFAEQVSVSPRLRYKGGAHGAGKTDSAVAVEPRRARNPGALGAASEVGSSTGPARPSHFGLCAGKDQHGSGAADAFGQTNRGKVAKPFRGAAARRAAG